jgi:hypothetical protein
MASAQPSHRSKKDNDAYPRQGRLRGSLLAASLDMPAADDHLGIGLEATMGDKLVGLKTQAMLQLGIRHMLRATSSGNYY